MIDDARDLAMKSRFPRQAMLALVLAVMAASCAAGNDGPPDGTGGAASGGRSGTGGSATGTGGSGNGGFMAGAGGAATGSGGAATGGATGGSGPAATGGRSGQTGGSASGGSRDGGAPDAGRGGAPSPGNGGSAGTSGATMSDGCGRTPTLKDGTQSIQSGGQNRSYMIRIPKNYDNRHPYWLMFGYHWVGGTANDVDSGGTSGYTWSYYGLREQADNSTNAQTIFVAPQGIGNAWGNGSNSDVIFTDDMIKKVEGDLCVDTKHVYAMGFSYGGGMTKALGCQRPNVFRAIGVFSGADFLSGGCDASSTAPIPFWGSHSITDGTNPYSSGITILNRFAKNDGCTAQTPPQPTGNNHVCTSFQGCKPGYPVEWCAFNGGGHTPAPVDGSSNGSGGGDKTWTKGELWKFFTQFQ